jgi:hypothetical protein
MEGSRRAAQSPLCSQSANEELADMEQQPFAHNVIRYAR